MTPCFSRGIVLRPTGLRWLGEANLDLCAHSPVEFIIGGEALVRPEDGDLAVSAAALFLLRTLFAPHTREAPVAEQLFPCCAHEMYPAQGQDELLIFGCGNGMDFEVVRVGVEVCITELTGGSHRLPFGEWRDAVCAFSDTVRNFYASTPKEPPSEDEEAFRQFLREWSRRRSLADGLA